MSRPTAAEINLESIAHNLRLVKERVGPDVRVLCAVKSNGYGHGAVSVSRTVKQHGADFLGVAMVEEGIELRRAGITGPIMVFAALAPDDVPALIKWGLRPALTHVDFARVLDRRARRANKRVKVHVNIDTGMGRVGFQTDEAVAAVTGISRMPNLLLEGLMTHFSTADEADHSFTELQHERFRKVIDGLHANAVRFPIVHAANSGAVHDHPASHFNMVRLGISLYGYRPSDDTVDVMELRPAMRLRSRIVYLKEAPAGATISYGKTFVTKRPTLVATIPIGYGDGYPRALSNRGRMHVHVGHDAGGVLCPVIGRVCMDQVMLDVTDVEGVKSGCEVTVYSTRRDEANSVESIARMLDTIPHEITCGLTARIPHIYLPARREKSEIRNPKPD